MSRAGDREESKRAWMRRHGFKSEADVIARANELAKELGLDQDPEPLEIPEIETMLPSEAEMAAMMRHSGSTGRAE